MMGNALLFLLLFVLLFYLPGRLLTALFLDERQPEETLPFSIGLGIILVHVPAFLVAGIANYWWHAYLDATILIVTSALASLGLTLLWLRRQAWRPRFSFPSPSRAVIALWLITAGSFAFYLLHYDEDLLAQDSCIVRAATGVIEDYLRPELLARLTREGKMDPHLLEALPQPQQDYYRFLSFNQGQRTGPTLLVAPFLTVYGVFGFRLVYALQGLLLPGLGFLAGTYLFKRRWAAWATSLLLTFNPYSTSVQLYNENFMALCFSSLALVLLLRPRPAPFLSGMALSLFLGIRHVGLVVLPATFRYLWRRIGTPPRAAWLALAGLCLFGLPCLIKHTYQFLYQGVLFEGAREHPLTPHSFFGVPFSVKLMLNFPFVDEPLRSPYPAFPTLVAFPLDLLRRFGLLLAALVPAGLVHLFRRDRPKAWLLVLWFVPLLLVLMVQANWTEPEKMGVPASVLLPVILVIVAGMIHLRESPLARRGTWALLGMGAGIPLLFYLAVREYRAPLDRRSLTFAESYHIRYEEPEPTRLDDEATVFVDRDRESYRPSLWPRFQLDQYHPKVMALRVAQLGDILSRPAIEDYEQTLADYVDTLLYVDGATVKPLSLARMIRTKRDSVWREPIRTWSSPGDAGQEAFRLVEWSFEGPPMLADGLVRRATGAPAAEPLRLDGGKAYLIWGLRTAWHDQEQMAFLARDWLGTVHLYSEPVIEGAMQAPPWLPLERVDGRAYADARVPLLVPEGAVIRYRTRPSTDKERRYLRYAVVGTEGVWSSEAFPMR